MCFVLFGFASNSLKDLPSRLFQVVESVCLFVCVYVCMYYKLGIIVSTLSIFLRFQSTRKAYSCSSFEFVVFWWRCVGESVVILLRLSKHRVCM